MQEYISHIISLIDSRLISSVLIFSFYLYVKTELFKLSGVLGETYNDMGNHDFAIELFKKISDECIEEFGKSSIERIRALSSLAAAYSHKGGWLLSLYPFVTFYYRNIWSS